MGKETNPRAPSQKDNDRRKNQRTRRKDMTLEEALAVYNNPSLESLPNEEWKTITDYPNYMISNFGRVKKNAYVHYHKDGRVFHYKSIIKKQTVSYGYMEIRLFNENKLGHVEGRLERTHRLIANAFIPNPENKPFIDHINTIRHDNRIENLRWCTSSENSNNPITLAKNKESSKKRYENPNERRRLAEMSKRNFSDPIFLENFKKRMNDEDVRKKRESKLRKKKVLFIDSNGNQFIYESANEAARQTGRSQGCISYFCLKNKKNKFNEIWMYI